MDQDNTPQMCRSWTDWQKPCVPAACRTLCRFFVIATQLVVVVVIAIVVVVTVWCFPLTHISLLSANVIPVEFLRLPAYQFRPSQFPHAFAYESSNIWPSQLVTFCK